MVKKLIASILMCVPVTVLAGFEVIEDLPKQEAKSASNVVAGPSKDSKNIGELQRVAVSYIGTPDADIPVVSGFVKDVKLLDAIKQIVPSGWQVFLKDDFVSKTNQTASWRGGRRWVDLLDILANEQGISVVVDWTKKSLFVGDRKITAAPVQINQVWVAKQGDTLRDSVTAWVNKSGWKALVWDADYDYPIEAQLTFEGSFRDAIVGIFRSYETAQRPLFADVHEPQKLIVVTPSNAPRK